MDGDGNGTDGLDENVALFAAQPHLAVVGSKLHAGWMETNLTAHQARVIRGH